MTTAVGLICADGLAVGTDMKVTAGDMKYSEPKLLTTAKLGERTLLIAGAGALRHINDAVGWLQLDKIKEIIGENPSFDDFLSKIVETTIPQFANDYAQKYGTLPQIQLIIGAIERDETPRLIQVYANGDYDHKDTFSAIGSGSIFGEILLRKLYHPQMTVQVAQRLIGYIIWEIQGIDNATGEDMQIVTLSKDGKASVVPQLEIDVYKHLPELVACSYEALRQRIDSLNLHAVQEAVRQLQDTVRKRATFTE